MKVREFSERRVVMTGEMYSITEDGVYSDGDKWSLHVAVAQAVGGSLKPFDRYQGPYIVIGEDIKTGHTPYEYPVMHVGATRLWICKEKNGLAKIYREDTDMTSESFHWEDEDMAIRLAKELLNEEVEDENTTHR